jgi:transcription elongation factor GreA
MSNTFPVTVAGAEKLKNELEALKKLRPEIIASISEARTHGDLKENAEYHAAKDQQGLAEARIRDIEGKLSNAQIIDVSKMTNTCRIVFGATVTLLDTNDDEVIYKIVGQDEADIKLGFLSIASPLARSLIGKEEGEEITIDTPSGSSEYSVSKVELI